eukprot:5755798-Pleurochrysis_carterae.AAC.1
MVITRQQERDAMTEKQKKQRLGNNKEKQTLQDEAQGNEWGKRDGTPQSVSEQQEARARRKGARKRQKEE